MWAVDGRVRVGVAWRGKGGGRGVLVVEHCCVPGMVLAKLFFVFFVAGFFVLQKEDPPAMFTSLPSVILTSLSLLFLSNTPLPGGLCTLAVAWLWSSDKGATMALCLAEVCVCTNRHARLPADRSAIPPEVVCRL